MKLPLAASRAARSAVSSTTQSERCLLVALRAAGAGLAAGLALATLVACATLAWLALEQDGIARALTSNGENLLATVSLIPRAIAATFLVAAGASVGWQGTAVMSTSGEFSLLTQGPVALVAFLIPLVSALRVGQLVARASTCLRRTAVTLAAAVVIAGVGATMLAVLASGTVGTDAWLNLTLELSPVLCGLAMAGWMTAGGTAGVVLERRRARTAVSVQRPLRWSACSPAATVAFMALLGALTLVGQPGGAGATDGPGAGLGLRDDEALPRAEASTPAVSDDRRQAVRAAVAKLREDSRYPVLVDTHSATGTAGFVRVRSVSGTTDREIAHVARAVAGRYAGMFGIQNLSRQLREVERTRDQLGMTHVRFAQAVGDRPVYGAELMVHFDVKRRISSLSSSLIPDVRLADSRGPAIDATSATSTAREALPGGTLVAGPRLAVYAGSPAEPKGAAARLSWIVRLALNATTVSNEYVVDARTGTLIGVIEHGDAARDRAVHHGDNGSSLPGRLVRREGGGATGDADADGAYNGSGSTYDYFRAKFGRDSYDNSGARLISTVHHKRGYANAFWNGSQMVYGDGFARSLDVTAHELSHAVTERTANLEYKNQSGAINEAISDIFGEMVERRERGRNDWLIGSELPIGAIRSMADPPAYGDPEHLSKYVVTCGDSGGVHTNSGIINKSFFNAVNNAGADAAERTYYRALTTYFNANTTFKQARSGLIQAATDLFGAGSRQVDGVTKALNAVGIDGSAEPQNPSCGCAAGIGLSGAGLAGLDDAEAGADDVLKTLYAVRDKVMPASVAGDHMDSVWDENTDRVSELLVADPALRQDAAQLLQDLHPGLAALASDEGDSVVMTPAVTSEVDTFLDRLATADVRSSGGELARDIAREREVFEVPALDGLSYEQVVEHMDDSVEDSG